MRLLLLIILIILSLACQSQDFTQYVNPFIGTFIERYTNPGAVFSGGLSLSPLNTYSALKNDWQMLSPYIYGRD